LHAMRRAYTREDYLDKIAMVRRSRRPISVTSDIIVGFPGENAADFDETLSLLDAVQFDAIFAFQYSPRPNTSSLALADPVPEQEKARRLQVLLERQRAIQSVRNQLLVNQTFEVLVEGASKREGQWFGRTTSNHLVNFTSPESDLAGQYISVQVTGAGPNNLSGEQVVGVTPGV
jgi:tRNA-2-methylthio-N6-dimethylallyladenosine synthase